jgi:RNA polymerase sigma-70 factor (ECF subfamily)
MTRADFDNLVRKLSRKLYGIAFRMLKEQQTSEDAVQEVMVKLWNMRSKLTEYESVDALSVTMIKNHCIDILRKQKHRVLTEESSLSLAGSFEPTPHELMERVESYETVQKIIEGLPDLYRDIIILRDIDELEYEEIVFRTGQNINTIRVNLSRARKMVRDEYKKYYNESGRSKTIA